MTNPVANVPAAAPTPVEYTDAASILACTFVIPCVNVTFPNESAVAENCSVVLPIPAPTARYASLILA